MGVSHISKNNTEAVLAPHGSFVPAPIDKLDQKNIENDWNRNLKFPNILFEV